MHPSFLVFVFLMARGGPGAKRRRSSAQQEQAEHAEDVGSEYNPADDSDRESHEENWEALQAEIQSTTREHAKGKGKEKAKGIEKEKGKSKATGKGKGKEKVGIEINEPGGGSPHRVRAVPVDSKRQRMYSSKGCVGERLVGVANLFEKIPGFQALFENGNLHAICDFPERTGYGLELIREFYMRAGHLVETEGGPYIFTTMVRDVPITITPAMIGLVLEMEASIDGVEYLHAGLDAVRDWKLVLNALCVPGAENNGSAILSKDLKIEYRFLNFIVCYNIMPLANTKVIRWDRVLYMYLLGRPDIVQARNLNMNIPFLIWKRMAREIKTASQKDRLPFPMIIMRILRLSGVNVICTSIEHSLGPISDTTVIKSSVQLRPHSPPHAPAPAPAPAPSSPPPAAPDDAASFSSIYSEQRRLSGELERQGAVLDQLTADHAASRQDMAKIKKRQGRISHYLRVLCEKLGCGSSDLPLPDSDSD